MLTSFLLSETGEHLVEYVIVLLVGQRVHHARLVQEITMYLGPVQSAVGHLHFDEMALNRVNNRRLDQFIVPAQRVYKVNSKS